MITDPITGDGLAGASDAPPVVTLNDMFKSGIRGGKPDTVNHPEPIRPAPKSHVEKAHAFIEGQKGEVDDIFKSFVDAKLWLLWIIGLISIGFGIQITMTTRAVEDPLINFLLGAGTVAGMLYGLVFANKLFNGLRAGAFVGTSKILAWVFLLIIIWEEITAMSAKFDPELVVTYVRVIGPACLGLYAVGTMAMALLKPDEVRNRKVHAIATRTEHNQVLRTLRGPERQAKAEAKADKMGAFAAMVARWKVVVLAGAFSFLRGWVIAWRQAWAMAGEKHEETGKHIASYEAKKPAKRGGGQRSKK